jgi:dihydrofolate reductase
MSSDAMSTVTLHVVSSLDGFIASKDNTVSWMDSPGDVYPNGTADEDAVIPPIDCYVLGSHTYEHALQLGWPYGDTPTFVVTSRALPSTRASVQFYSGELTPLIADVLAPRYRHIWLVGGAKLCQSFLQLGLVDEIRLMLAPVTLGQGLLLFGTAGTEQKWQLSNVLAYRNGYVDLSYRRASASSSDPGTPASLHP